MSLERLRRVNEKCSEGLERGRLEGVRLVKDCALLHVDSEPDSSLIQPNPSKVTRVWILFSNFLLAPLCGLSTGVHEPVASPHPRPGAYNWLVMDLGVAFESLIRTDPRRSGCFLLCSGARPVSRLGGVEGGGGLHHSFLVPRVVIPMSASLPGGGLWRSVVVVGWGGGEGGGAAADETCQVSCSLRLPVTHNPS